MYSLFFNVKNKNHAKFKGSQSLLNQTWGTIERTDKWIHQQRQIWKEGGKTNRNGQTKFNEQFVDGKSMGTVLKTILKDYLRFDCKHMYFPAPIVVKLMGVKGETADTKDHGSHFRLSETMREGAKNSLRVPLKCWPNELSFGQFGAERARKQKVKKELR